MSSRRRATGRQATGSREPTIKLCVASSPKVYRRHVASDQVTDTFDRYVGGRVGRDVLGVESVVPLTRKDSRDPISPLFLHRRQYSELVVNHYVVTRRVPLLDILEHLLLVNVD